MDEQQQNAPANAPGPTFVQHSTNIDDDQINLVDYFRVIWKRKYFILLASAVPAFVSGAILFLLPRNYSITYVYDVRGRDLYGVKAESNSDTEGENVYTARDLNVYDVGNWNLNQYNYKILLTMFYSDENTNRIKARSPEYCTETVNFDVWPPFAKIRNDVNLEQIKQMRAQLLSVTILAGAKNNISKISSVIRDNLENVMLLNVVMDQLNTAVRKLRAGIAAIEQNRPDLELALTTNKAILAKLKNIENNTSNMKKNNFVLQFDPAEKTEHLPLEYQIQVTESKAIRYEEQLIAENERSSRYKHMLELNEKMCAELQNKMSSRYTIQQFRLFLIDLIDDHEELKDYLSSYVKKIENKISATVPVTENPRICVEPRNTFKKTAVAFAVLLMAAVLAAFLLEAVQKSEVGA